MAPLGSESEANGRHRNLIGASVVLLLALATAHLPEASQQRISGVLRASVLRPFIFTQERLEEASVGAAQADSLMAIVDSLSAVLSTHSALLNENRTLRDLLALAERAGPGYVPATVLRPGTSGSESVFLVDIGERDGVSQGSPVVNPRGLVGVIREVRSRSAVGMDWTHPDFRVSAMLADGSAYGLVENRPGRFREDDRLILNGVAYNQEIELGSMVVTSGFEGGVYPRGIPIGRIDELRDEQGSWRRSYWLIPMVEPGAATHVVVLTNQTGGDVLDVWASDTIGTPNTLAAPDSIGAETIEGGEPPR
jgi:cell shape-determining protein MreC